MTRFFLTGALLLALTANAAPLDYYLPEGATFDGSVPTPDEVIEHDVGEWHVTHDKLVYYMRALAAASPRVSIEEYGRSYEDRPLVLVAITHPDNQARLDEIRAAREQYREGTRPESRNDLTVVWLGHSIHGNEPSGANSSLLTAYYWAATQGDDVDQILRDTIILIDPAINPDGINRFASWVNSHRSRAPVIDRQNREQNEAWPRGRTNHYWFDLNRDWLPVQMPESQGRIAAIQKWRPNFMTDQHEMGTDTTFFFQPGIPTRIHPLIPDENYGITEQFGEAYAKAMDAIGSMYYARENYDDYYIGRGPTYNDFNGGIAVLFEQASARGHAQESVNGVLTFPFAIRNQFTLTTATVTTAHKLGETLKDYMLRYYKTAREEAAKDRTRAFVFGSASEPMKSHALATLIARHDIDVFELAGELEVGNNSFADAAYIVPVDQAQYRLIQGIFEIRNEFEDNTFYDVSAWTLPLAFNLPYSGLSGRAFSDRLLGAPFDPTPPTGTFSPADNAYAYAFQWHGYFSPRALYRLLDAGALAKVSMLPFALEGEEMDRGAIILPVGAQPIEKAELETLLATIAKEDGIDIKTFSTGYTPEGPDLGSRNMITVEKPYVMVLGDQGTDGYEVGEFWHLLDQRYHMPATVLPTPRFGAAELSRYTTIVMVDGNHGWLGEPETEKLKAWVRAGGTLIAQKSAVETLIKKGLSDEKMAEIPDAFEGPQAYENFVRLNGAERIGGSIFRASIDVTHPIAFGYTTPEIPVFKRGVMVMADSDKSFAYPLRYTESPRWSGYLSPAKTNLFDNTPAVAINSMGKGRVILMTDNPAFRAFWYGTNKLMANAIFFGPLITAGTTK